MLLRVVVLAACVLAAAAVSASHRHRFPACRHRDHSLGKSSTGQTAQDSSLDTIARDLQALDDKIQKFCISHSNGQTRETVDPGRYKITTPLTGFTQTDFNITIQGRALLISANNVSGRQYTEVRILPTFVRTLSASYVYDGQELKVVLATADAPSACAAAPGRFSVPPYVQDSGPRLDDDDTDQPNTNSL